jgi:hypothetical protein
MMAKELTSFQKEFAKARREGKKVFNFNGKKYTTEMAKPKAGISRDMPSAPSGGGMDDDRRFAPRAGISRDMPSAPSGGGMDDDRRAGGPSPSGMSVNERIKESMAKTRADTRPVTERLGGTERKMKSEKTDGRSAMERMKAAREKAREGSGKTDERSVNERIRSALGFKKGGSVKGCGIAKRGLGGGTMR